MTPGNEKSVAHMPIGATPKAKQGAKLHGFKFDYYAGPKGDDLMLSWVKCGDKDVTHCTNEEEFIDVMRALYARLATQARKKAPESEAEIDQIV